METISISKLKAGLSGEIRKVRSGESLLVLDHNHPVAKLVPLDDTSGNIFIKEAERPYVFEKLPALMDRDRDVVADLEEDRNDRW